MTHAVYYISADDFGLLAPGTSYFLQGDEGHHAKNVKRAVLGEGLDLVDGLGHRAITEVKEIVDGGLLLAVKSLAHDEAGILIYLVQALAKGDRDIQAIEMATELGAHGIIPWSAERSIVRWKAERARKAHAKWQNTVKAAAKQSRRAFIPPVYPLHDTAELADRAHEIGAKALFLILHEQASCRLSEVLAQHLRPEVEEIYFVVGPEGGISPRELNMLEDAGAQAVLLGSQVLRSSTAGAAAISALAFALGRW